MAKLKKTARKTASSKSPQFQDQAERLSKNLGESAQQVWLAGVGAFGRAQSEGTKLFETLVKEGLSLEQITRKVAGGKVEAVRDAVESTVGQARCQESSPQDRQVSNTIGRTRTTTHTVTKKLLQGTIQSVTIVTSPPVHTKPVCSPPLTTSDWRAFSWPFASRLA